MSALCFCGAPATTGALCTQDLARLQVNIRRAPGVLEDLDVTIVGLAKQGGGGAGGTPDVFNERASDARINLTYLLRTAAKTADPATPAGLRPAQLAVFALGGIDTLARSPGAHTTAQDLRDALIEADRVRDRAEERISYGPCLCGVELLAPRSKDTAKCRNPECGQQWDVQQLKAFRHVSALDAVPDYQGTIKEVLTVLKHVGITLNRNTVDSWVAREKLVPVEGKIFRARDVLEMSQSR